MNQVFPCFDIPSVPDILPAGVDWKFYGTNFYVLHEIWSMFDAVDVDPQRAGLGERRQRRRSSTSDIDEQDAARRVVAREPGPRRRAPAASAASAPARTGRSATSTS